MNNSDIDYTVLLDNIKQTINADKVKTQSLNKTEGGNSGQDSECCICYESDCFIIKTKCKHELCMLCISKLKKHECPMCRTEFPEDIKALLFMQNTNTNNIEPLSPSFNWSGTPMFIRPVTRFT